MKSAGRIPYVLMLTAQNLCTRSNLCSISNGCLSQDAITSDVTPRADAGLRVSKKRAERDSAGHRTLGRGADDNNQPEDSLRRRMEPSHRIVRRTCRSALCGQNKTTPPAAWQQQGKAPCKHFLGVFRITNLVGIRQLRVAAAFSKTNSLQPGVPPQVNRRVRTKPRCP